MKKVKWAPDRLEDVIMAPTRRLSLFLSDLPELNKIRHGQWIT